MRKIILIGVLCAMAAADAAAQTADLIVNSINFPAGNLNKGDRVSFSFTVKNSGSAAASASHTAVYLSPNFTYTSAVLLTMVSCKALSAGEISPAINCSLVIPYPVTAGSKYLLLKADAKSEVTESNETNDFHSAGTINITASTTIAQNLPYPIIFVHGFTSSDDTWAGMKTYLQNTYGFSFGGNMNFCLNQDNNLATSNKVNDYKDWTRIDSLQAGDFFTVNFDTDTSGNKISNSDASTALESNQAGIVKQGLAIRDAVKHVLQVTGKTKVILCGHSMGGLACREYLQNTAIWQPDGMHHVARLTTLGTPHGGTDLTGAGLGSLAGLDEYSEGVRDMRTTYWWTGDPGVYLFGGKESYSVMQFYPFFNYDNVDVNCNGVDADGSTISGINSKAMPTNIAYTCVIGTASGSGDYVVSEQSADLNNYRPVGADTFRVDAAHTSLTSQTTVNVKALDESKNSATAYSIDPGKIYSGLFTQQSVTAATQTDSDYYRFAMPTSGNIRAELMNIPVKNSFVKIYDADNVLKYSAATNAGGFTDNISGVLPPGNYFLNIAGTPEAGADADPYSFRLSFLQIVPLSLLNFDAAAKNNTVALNWNTADENGIANYELQRSGDGVSWIYLTQKTGLDGNANDTYAATDSFPLVENYYRLKINNNNGGFSYSNVRKVLFYTTAGPSFSISPNPASTSAVLTFDAATHDAFVVVTDLQGRIIFRDKITQSRYMLDTHRYAAGVYIVRVINGSGETSSKVVVEK